MKMNENYQQHIDLHEEEKNNHLQFNKGNEAFDRVWENVEKILDQIEHNVKVQQN